MVSPLEVLGWIAVVVAAMVALAIVSFLAYVTVAYWWGFRAQRAEHARDYFVQRRFQDVPLPVTDAEAQLMRAGERDARGWWRLIGREIRAWKGSGRRSLQSGAVGRQKENEI